MPSTISSLLPALAAAHLCCLWSQALAFDVAPLPTKAASAKTKYHHEFWRKERSHAEVESHVYDSLAATDVGTTAKVHVVSAEPPLVLVHDFVSEATCDEIVAAAQASPSMRTSTTGNDQKKNDSRTSTTVWLNDETCTDPSRLIAERVASISGLPPSHMENLQVVRYQPGQEFNLHTDHQESFNDLECRGRLATCLIYLQEPESGGETLFPAIEGPEIKIAPRRGSAVFFFNTQEKPGCNDYAPLMFLNTDFRMKHAGLPVVGGEKWVCNRWIHPIDFGAGVRGL